MSRDQDFVIEHIKRLGCHTMTDIVERLRFLKTEIEELVGQDIEEIEEAAAEIERLKAERNDIKRMLEEILEKHGYPKLRSPQPEAEGS
jgi:chromosome segregation ATPase